MICRSVGCFTPARGWVSPSCTDPNNIWMGEEGWGFSLAELFLSHHRVVLKRHDLETSGLIWLKHIYSRSLKIKKKIFPTLSKTDLNTHHNKSVHICMYILSSTSLPNNSPTIAQQTTESEKIKYIMNSPFGLLNRSAHVLLLATTILLVFFINNNPIVVVARPQDPVEMRLVELPGRKPVLSQEEQIAKWKSQIGSTCSFESVRFFFLPAHRLGPPSPSPFPWRTMVTVRVETFFYY